VTLCRTYLSFKGDLSLLETIYIFTECKLGERAAVLGKFMDCVMPVSGCDSSTTTTEEDRYECFVVEFCTNKFIPTGAPVAPMLRQFLTESRWDLMAPIIDRKYHEMLPYKEDCCCAWIDTVVTRSEWLCAWNATDSNHPQ